MQQHPLKHILFTALTLASLALPVRAADFTVAYQTTVDPAKAAQASQRYEAASAARIDWRKFDSGAEVIQALASGDVQIGYVGSSPLAAAASQRLPIQTFLIAAEIGSAEALVVRRDAGIDGPQALAGKTIAVPFVSTGHYSLLAALKHWQLDPASVRILNLSPPAIISAWQRGDIDAAYVWEPALGVARASGQVLIDSAELAALGSPTFDAWVVRREFAEQHPDWVRAFADVTLQAYADYQRDPTGWLASATHREQLATLSGARPEDIGLLLKGNRFPDRASQQRALSGPVSQALAQTAGFLKAQGTVDRLLDDYSSYVSPAYVTP